MICYGIDRALNIFPQLIVRWIQREQKRGHPVTSRMIVRALVYARAKEEADEKVIRTCRRAQLSALGAQVAMLDVCLGITYYTYTKIL